MRWMRIVTGLLIALLPSRVKVAIYRLLYRYEIGKGVRIGFGTAFVGVGRCRIRDGARIGRLNLFYQIAELEVGERAHIGWLNAFRGGHRVTIGSYASVLRLNVFNSILDPDVVTAPDPTIELGSGAVVTTGHWLDFTDRISIGPHSILGGRQSSLWTHNRQRTRPITVGAHCYIGSTAQFAPGVEVPDYCIVALGAVLMGRYEPPCSLIVGNPAAVQRPLREQDIFLVTRKTRPDIPDEAADAETALGLFDPSPEVQVG